MKLQKLKQITQKARKDFEMQRINEVELNRLYTQYNPLENIDSFLLSTRGLFPRLNCGLASVYLQNLIPESEVIRGRFKNNNHTFLLVKKEIIIDITSDQYGGPKVYVGPIKIPWAIPNLRKMD